MSEPSQNVEAVGTEATKTLMTLLQHEHPGAQVQRIDNKWIVLTLHSVGATELEALENAIHSNQSMKARGESLREQLDNIYEDLSAVPGMSKERHATLHDMLNFAENSLNDAVLTKTVAWILIPSLTREIANLRRRVDMRLAMMAAEMADREKAKKKAAEKPTPPIETDWANYKTNNELYTETLTPFQKLRRMQEIALRYPQSA